MCRPSLPVLVHDDQRSRRSKIRNEKATHRGTHTHTTSHKTEPRDGGGRCLAQQCTSGALAHNKQGASKAIAWPPPTLPPASPQHVARTSVSPTHAIEQSPPTSSLSCPHDQVQDMSRTHTYVVTHSVRVHSLSLARAHFLSHRAPMERALLLSVSLASRLSVQPAASSRGLRGALDAHALSSTAEHIHPLVSQVKKRKKNINGATTKRQQTEKQQGRSSDTKTFSHTNRHSLSTHNSHLRVL